MRKIQICLILFAVFNLITFDIVAQIDAGKDTTICFGDSVQLQASGATIYNWSPDSTLSDLTIPNPIAKPTVTTTYYVSCPSENLNLILNGDFEAGNVGFTSDYIYDPDLEQEGRYYITSDPSQNHQDFAACVDHSLNGDNMMVVNGSTFHDEKVWCCNVNVFPNSDYEFEFWATSVCSGDNPELEVRFNNIKIGNSFLLNNNLCEWQNFSVVWNSGNLNNVNVCLVNANNAVFANDFAIDDISLRQINNIEDSVTVTVNPNPEVSITSSDICIGGSAVLQAIGANNYVWYNGATTETINIPSFDENEQYFVIGESLFCYDTTYFIGKAVDCELVFPNFISPNKDGYNDLFVIEGIERYEYSKLLIFNRWGKKIYESGDKYLNNWGDENLADGTYYYVITLKNGDNSKNYNGTISLLKN